MSEGHEKTIHRRKKLNWPLNRQKKNAQPDWKSGKFQL